MCIRDRIELVVPRTVAGVRGPASPGLRRALLLMPTTVGCQRHRHENGAAFFTSALVATAPRLLDDKRKRKLSCLAVATAFLLRLRR